MGKLSPDDNVLLLRYCCFIVHSLSITFVSDVLSRLLLAHYYIIIGTLLLS